MNKKISILSAVLIIALMLTPLLASVEALGFNNKEKIPVTFTRADVSGYIVNTHTCGDLLIVKVNHGFNTYIVEGDGIYLEKLPGPLGTSIYFIDAVTGEGWAITSSELVFEGGSFKGIIFPEGVFGIIPAGPLQGMPLPLDVTQKGVWHGNREYSAWTLVIEFETGDDPVEGYILVPQ